VGGAWATIISLLFVPIYIKFMGIESYGLIGIFMSLVALLSVLDMGLSATLSRELARLSSTSAAGQESRDLLRTFEIIYWGVGTIIGLGLVILAPIIARYWIDAQQISVKTTEGALMAMGLVVAFQWPASLYGGGLLGLQRQVLLNTILICVLIIQSFGAVLVLWLISPTILAYFIWQIFMALLHTSILARYLWCSLPKTDRQSRFQKYLLTKTGGFAVGITGISVVTTILTQLDKIILSKLLTLEMFGYYMLAASVARVLNRTVSPIFSTLFPKFSQMVAQNDLMGLTILYHKSCQLLSLLVLPVATMLVFFPEEILSSWLRNPVVAKNSYILLILLVIGTTLNSIMTIPYCIQLAYGWTKLAFYKNVIAIVILVPLMIWLVSLYLAEGAAIIWIILNASYFLIEIPIMHRRLLKDQMYQWYIYDVGMPLLAVTCVGIASRVFMPDNMSVYLSLFWIFLTGVVALLCSALVMPLVREWFRKKIFIW
jgi:O-antigen/teichoic acid export membrane protein